MRSSSILSALLAATPMAVSAAGQLGFSLGATNPDNSCKSTSDYEADMQAIRSNSGSTLVRIYAAGQCNTSANILPAAQSSGFQVLLGVWPDTDASFELDTSALQASVPGNENLVYGITVGSETLYRGNFTGSQLLGKIQQVEQMFPNVTIGTADSWNMYADGTADALITGGVKLLLGNAFSFWQAQGISNATATYFDDIQKAIGHVQELSGSLDAVHFMTGETGWPTDGGSNYGPATAGTANAKIFWQQGVCGMLDWGFDVFYFEAFDEPSKPDSIGQDGTAANEQHWGAMDAGRNTKFRLGC